jgi:predicted nucleic acid-binding protein
MAGDFFDSNVLLYVASGNVSKANRAEAIILKGGIVSVQVLNEVAHVARRKMGMSWEDARSFLATIRALLIIEPITIETHETGIFLAERYQLSTYDAMIAASALLADCDRLWSEDMQHNFVIDRRLRVSNPFRTAP